MTPEQEAEAIEIELELRRRRAAGGKKSQVSTPEVSSKSALQQESILMRAPGSVIADELAKTTDDLRQKGWENLSASERFKLLASNYPKYLKRELLGAETMVERAAPVAIGQTLGRISRLPGADRALGAIGGAVGEAIAEKREGGDLQPGRIAEAALSGMIRGRPLAGAGAKEVVTEAAKYAGVNVVGSGIEKSVDEGRLPTAEEAAMAAAAGAIGAPVAKAFSEPVEAVVRNRPRLFEMEDEVLRDLRKEGVVVPPHEIEGGSQFLSNVGGKAALQQEAARRNQGVWQKMAREEIGLSKEAVPIRPSELDALRASFAEPYRKISDIQRNAKDQLETFVRTLSRENDPHAVATALDSPANRKLIEQLEVMSQADVDRLKQVRRDMQRSRKAFFGGDPNAYQQWQNSRDEAQRIEEAIERAAVMNGDPKLLQSLRESRKKIAQIYAVDDSLNPGNGFVDPLVFGRKKMNDEPLSGNLDKIARFQLAFRREAVEAGRVPAPGVGNLGSMASIAMASRGDAPGVVGAIVNATAGRLARPYLLSDFVQDGLITPGERQNFGAIFARYLSEKAAEDRELEAEEIPAR